MEGKGLEVFYGEEKKKYDGVSLLRGSTGRKGTGSFW